MVPGRLFLTKGVGRHREKLHSFELALRDAGIAHLNLVVVSSVLPPGCEVVSKEKGLGQLEPGEITYVVMARNETNEPHRLLSASVGLAVPANPSVHGYISEHHAYGQTDEISGDYAEDLAATMLATILGLDFDAEQAWDQRKQHYRTSELIIRTTNETHSATGDKHGLWTTVAAAVVFIP